jgi:hypothetical protein
MATAPASTGIEVTAKFFWLFFVLLLWPPLIEVDGQETKGQWNSPIQVAATPGKHRVKIQYKYYWFLPGSPAEVDVEVPASGMSHVSYEARWLFLLAGKVTVS